MFASAIIPIAIDEEETDVREGDLARHAEEALLSKRPPVVLEALDRKYYDDGHIPTARLLPLTEIDRAPAIVADKDQAIVLYCASANCRNSHQAAAHLERQGYRNVAVYPGGKADWVGAGLRLEK